MSRKFLCLHECCMWLEAYAANDVFIALKVKGVNAYMFLLKVHSDTILLIRVIASEKKVIVRNSMLYQAITWIFKKMWTIHNGDFLNIVSDVSVLKRFFQVLKKKINCLILGHKEALSLYDASLRQLVKTLVNYGLQIFRRCS